MLDISSLQRPDSECPKGLQSSVCTSNRKFSLDSLNIPVVKIEHMDTRKENDSVKFEAPEKLNVNIPPHQNFNSSDGIGKVEICTKQSVSDS